MRFSGEHVQVFSRLSRDHNPLHVDPAYARRTQFGRPVFFGMGAVLACLGEWAKGRSFSLGRITGDFKKPVFLDEDYRLEAVEKDTSVTLRLWSGDSARLVVRFDFAMTAAFQAPADRPGEHLPRAEQAVHLDAERVAQIGRRWSGYSLEGAALADLERCFGLNPKQIPQSQLTILAGSSYLVGMELPGRSALYSDFEFDFRNPSGPDSLTAEKDDRFNKILIRGSLAGRAEFSIGAFTRPEPVDSSIDEIRQLLGQTQALQGQRVLVTGASRGFGAVLAKAFALRGANVVLNARSDSADLREVLRQLTSVGASSTAVLGDVSQPEDCQRMLEMLRGQKLDWLVLNAFPTAGPFDKPSTEQLARYRSQAFASVRNPLEAFSSALSPHANVVFISSRFVKYPEPGFAPYIEAKSELETEIRQFSSRRSGLKYWIVRPPRILTDQTNTIQPVPGLISPIACAKILFDQLADLDGESPLHELDL